MGFNPVAVTDSSNLVPIAPVSSEELLDNQANIECRFTLKCMCDMIITYSTSCLSTPAESTPESSPVKTRPTKSVPSEKDLNFLPLQCVLVIWVTPREILNCWAFPMNFWSFGISLLILLQQPLVPGYMCQF